MTIHTKEFIDQVLDMIRAGKSYAEIQAKMKLTEGQLSGIAYRDRIKSHVFKVTKSKAPVQVQKTITKRSEKQVAVAPKILTAFEEPKEGQGVEIASLKAFGQCRWPLSSFDGVAERFCGEVLSEGKGRVYCDGHHALAYPSRTRESMSSHDKAVRFQLAMQAKFNKAREAAKARNF